MRDILALASGGMDSSTLCYHLRDRLGLIASVDYGQRHDRELRSAKAIADRLDVEHVILDLRPLGALLTGSALTDDIDVPHGHYAAENMRQTVVPNRNMIMLAAAGGVAVARGLSSVATAVHAGDHFVYPDCRPEFIESISETMRLATASFGDVTVDAPFVNMTKADIAKLGDELNVPWATTWTCYEGGSIHCGRCATCVERIEAFHLAAVDDPTPYDDRDYWRTVVAP
jgi:7-cyano-7-deazaguanine synthase